MMFRKPPRLRGVATHHRFEHRTVLSVGFDHVRREIEIMAAETVQVVRELLVNADGTPVVRKRKYRDIFKYIGENGRAAA